jgi:type IV pilus assembly protein PilB
MARLPNMTLKNSDGKRIGEILIEEGVLRPQELEKGLELQKKEGGLIGSILVRMGCVSEEVLVAALSKQLSIPFLHLENYNINCKAQKHISKEIAKKYTLFPFDESQKIISIAMSDPLNKEAHEALEKATTLKKHIFLAPVSEITEAIELYYSDTDQTSKRKT